MDTQKRAVDSNVSNALHIYFNKDTKQAEGKDRLQNWSSESRGEA